MKAKQYIKKNVKNESQFTREHNQKDPEKFAKFERPNFELDMIFIPMLFLWTLEVYPTTLMICMI